MTAAELPSLRRRPIPGMSHSQPTPPTTQPTDEEVGTPLPAPSEAQSPAPTGSTPEAARPQRQARSQSETSAPASGALVPARRPSSDYATTRLVNFRLPADLHDRFKQLVREVEQRHPRLRHPSLTELIIGLLEEGPQTADEVAELIRRKRADEHASGSAR